MKKFITFIWITALLLVLSIGGWFIWRGDKEDPGPIFTPVSIQQKKAADPYTDFLARHRHPDRFEPVDEEGVRKIRNRVLGLLQEYRGTSNRTKEIVDTLAPGLGFTAFIPEGTVGDLRRRGGNILVVAVLSQDQFLKPQGLANQGVFFAYRRGEGLMLMPAIEYPDKLLASTLFHELGHMMLDLEGKAGIRPPRQPIGSAEYFEEEVEMTELQGKVMDAVVKGEFTKLLDRIIDRSGALGQEGKYSFLFSTLLVEDLRKFEELFDLGEVGEGIAKTALSHLSILLEFRYIDRNYHGTTEGVMAQKVWRYKRMREKMTKK